MSRIIKIAELPEFDLADHLKTVQDVAQYLTMVLEESDGADLPHALGVIARARGMTEVASEAGLTLEALYKALEPNSQPSFETVVRICKAFGVKLVVKPENV